MKKLIIALLLILFPVQVQCACVADGANWASTPDYASVAECVVNADAGDTITVSAGGGTETWSSALVLTKGVILVGPGKTNLTVKMGFARANSNTCQTNNHLIRFTPATAANSETVKITGFTFDIDSQGGAMQFNNGNNSGIDTIIIGNNDFKNSTSRMIEVCDTFYGVIYSNTFDTIGSSAFAAYGRDSATWNALDFAFGSANNLYFEGNTLTNVNNTPHSAGQGGRYVIRHNTYSTSIALVPWFDMHGNQPSGVTSTMGAEIYRNELTTTSANAMYISDQRGGMAAIYANNVVTPGSSTTINLWEEYADECSPVTNQGGQAQHVSGSYYWSNTRNSTTAINAAFDTSDSTYCRSAFGCDHGAETCTCTSTYNCYPLTAGVDYSNSELSYTPYGCPHTLTGLTGSCTTTIGTGGYNQATTHTVTVSTSTGCSVTYAGANTVGDGETLAVTMTAAYGYTASGGGTCGGTLSSGTYTTSAITADCTATCTGLPKRGVLGGTGTVSLGGSGVATLGN